MEAKLSGRGACKHVTRLDSKIFRQVVVRILELGQNPRPHDSEELKGYGDPVLPGRKGFRVDQGEYRILYTIDEDRRMMAVCRPG